MKQFYTLIALFFVISIYGQGYEFAIVQNSNYNFSIVAVPDFASTGNTDISDIGFALMLPAGNADVANLSQFNGRTLSSTQIDAATLTANGLGDGTRDGFLINLPPGQTLLAHTAGEQIVITTFDVTNMPITGQLEILANTDPIATGLGGSVDSFYNSNIDGTTTQDYFGGIAAGQGSFMFSVLNVDEPILEDLSLKVFPNPVKHILHIDTNLDIDKLELYDIRGKLIVKQINKRLDFEFLESGVYLLKIYTDTLLVVKRIIKE